MFIVGQKRKIERNYEERERRREAWMQSIGDLIIDKDVNKSEYDIKNNY